MDGMYARIHTLKTVVFLALLLLPFIISGISFSKPISIEKIDFGKNSSSNFTSVFIAGEFQYFEITLTTKAEKISIVAFYGDSIPEIKDRSSSNYYNWQYNNGNWFDASTYYNKFIKSSECKIENNTYYFCIKLDNKAKPGNWNFKIIVDDEEKITYNFSIIVITQFNIFLSTFIALYQPSKKDAMAISESDLIFSEQKKKQLVLKEDINDIVEKVIKNNLKSDNTEKKDEKIYPYSLELKKNPKDESNRVNIFNYQKSMLKNTYKNSIFLLLKKKFIGGNNFWFNKINSYSKFLILLCSILLLFSIFTPVISPLEKNSIENISFINDVNLESFKNSSEGNFLDLDFINISKKNNSIAPYDIFNLPNNSLGPRSNKIINTSYFWNFFNNVTNWFLEVWDSENKSWINVTQNLIINKTRNENNLSEKIALEFSAPISGDYKLTFIIDKPLKSYVNKSDQNIYELNYSLDNEEEYLTFFDFNDIVGIPNIIINHGVRNINGSDIFWFSAQKNDVKEGTYIILDPTFGNSATSTSTTSIEDYLKGGYFQMGSYTGYGSSITAYIYSNGGTKSAKCALYDSSKNLVANSMTEQKVYSTGWNTFNFNTTKPLLTANSWYYIVIWSNDGSGLGYLYYSTSGGSGVFSDTETYVAGSYSGFPSPFEGTTIDVDGLASIYCTYIVAPIVTTNATTGIEDINATLNGYLQNDGGQASDCGLRYGTTSATYTQNFTKGTYTNNTPFSNNNGSLTSGDLYYVQAWAKNTVGFSTGNELRFFTKPPKTTNFIENTSTNTTLTYNWTKPIVGVGATAFTHIQYKIGSNPTTIIDGTNTYNGTGSTDNTVNLEPGTLYYFSAFSWAIENGEGRWNDSYTAMNAWTNPGDPGLITVINGTNWINITFSHGINGSHTLIRRNETGNATYPKNREDGILVKNTTDQYINDTGLTPEIIYYYTLWTWDADGQKWCDTNKTVTGTTFINQPLINSYNLLNDSGSKLNNATGLLDVNNEYYFTINASDYDGWEDIEYINITSWYDNGNDNTVYNQTLGGNLNMFLQYENISGIPNFKMLWPDDEAQIVLANCSEEIVNSTTRIINISFKPLGQVRWANSNETWNTSQNAYNDPYSWNFNITISDKTNRSYWRIDEYGAYKFTYISPSQDWVDVYALPGFNDTSNVVSISYSSNYDFNMNVFFEENLTNQTWGETIPIANNVDIIADADLNDDITTDMTFFGVGEINSIEIFNESGFFNTDNTNQTVNVQFRVYIPFGTLGVKYTTHVFTKIVQD